MEKLSIEEKAKAYDEALERAKEQLEGAKVFDYEEEQIAHDIRTTAYAIFPELKEPGDEKIRKDIIVLVKDWWDRVNKYNISTKETMIAWLEKQGTSYTKRDVDDAYVEGMAFAKDELEKQSEQKPDWSIKEKLMLNDIIETTERSNIFKENYQRELIDWLKSLKNRVLPQPKQEWSEEDEKMCQETIDWFEKKCFPYALENENPARESIKWLKSLKQRIGE